MRFIHLLPALLAAEVATALRFPSRGPLPKQDIPKRHVQNLPRRPSASMADKKLPYHYKQLNANYTKYFVDGTALPDVDFDIGESYAGLMPISSAANASQLYFWYFPTANPDGSDDITIWLNGGPGCSSLEGFLQEIGPVLWQYGTFRPVQNPWTWVNLTSVVWVEQPVGTGFSQGTPIAKDETTVAEQFLGFWKNLIDTFGLHNKKVYMAGESYAGVYIPYIADAMLNTKDTTYYGVESIMLYDPFIADDTTNQVSVVPFVDYHKNLLPLNASTMDYLHAHHKSCGYQAFNDKYFNYPATGPIADLPPANDSCDLWSYAANAANIVNPCFDIFQIATTCPLPWDSLGSPGSFDYLPQGASIYFNRESVQKAINAPIQKWKECGLHDVLNTYNSDPPSWSVLPRVIERTTRTIIAHGLLDILLLSNGSLIAIQNMTWNGAQGFSEAPSTPFFVPYHDDPFQATLGASGVMGTTHTERGLTWIAVALSGHMIPQYQPTAAYRMLEFMLGRIPSVSVVSDFTTQTGDYGNKPGLLG